MPAVRRNRALSPEFGRGRATVAPTKQALQRRVSGMSISEATDITEEPVIGTAQWMPPEQVAANNPYQKGAIWIGRNGTEDREAIGRKDDSHVLLCAKTRAAKGRAIITNNLLMWPGSVFCNDPKGENASITAARRGQGSQHIKDCLNQDVYVLDSHDVSQVDNKYRAYYNVLDELSVDDPDTPTKAGVIAESCISRHAKADPTWDNKARTFIKALILHIISNPWFDDHHPRDMVTLRRFVVAGDVFAVEHAMKRDPKRYEAEGPPDGFKLLLMAMAANTAFDGIIAEQARSYQASRASQPKMWNSIRTSAEEHTDWIDDTRIRTVLRSSETRTRTFKARDLQRKEGGVSVFLCLKSSLKDTLSSWPRILVNMILMAAQDDQNQSTATGHQTLMMLDEFASLERMPQIETAAADIAGAGVKMFFVVQSLNQLANPKAYAESWETFLNSADTHIYYGFNDNFTAEYVSKRLGEVELIRRMRSSSSAIGESEAEARTTGDSIARGSTYTRTKSGGEANSRGGGSNQSSSSGIGQNHSHGWGPHWLIRSLEHSSQHGRSSNRNSSSGSQRTYQSTKNAGWANAKGRSTTRTDQQSETQTITNSQTNTHGWSETLHRKPLADVAELMKLFGAIEDPSDPTYPGICLVSNASTSPWLVHKCFYDEDEQFTGLFDPHPKHGLPARVHGGSLANELQNGSEYVFTAKGPESFRYALELLPHLKTGSRLNKGDKFCQVVYHHRSSRKNQKSPFFTVPAPFDLEIGYIFKNCFVLMANDQDGKWGPIIIPDDQDTAPIAAEHGRSNLKLEDRCFEVFVDKDDKNFVRDLATFSGAVSKAMGAYEDMIFDRNIIRDMPARIDRARRDKPLFPKARRNQEERIAGLQKILDEAKSNFADKEEKFKTILAHNEFW
jgi:type IV secretory pathway TraG/TraD family ATPase VirD4